MGGMCIDPLDPAVEVLLAELRAKKKKVEALKDWASLGVNKAEMEKALEATYAQVQKNQDTAKAMMDEPEPTAPSQAGKLYSSLSLGVPYFGNGGVTLDPASKMTKPTPKLKTVEGKDFPVDLSEAKPCSNCGAVNVLTRFHPWKVGAVLGPMYGFRGSDEEGTLHIAVPGPVGAPVKKIAGDLNCPDCHVLASSYHVVVYNRSPRAWMEWFLGTYKPPDRSGSGVELSRSMAEFYLLAYVEGQAKAFGLKQMEDVARGAIDGVSEELSEPLQEYLYRACLGESRHYRRVLDSAHRIEQMLKAEDTKDNIHARTLARYHVAEYMIPVEKSTKELMLGGPECELCMWMAKKMSTPGANLGRESCYSIKPPKGYTRQQILQHTAEVFACSLWGSSTTFGGPLWATAAELGANVGKLSSRSICDRVFNLAHNGGTIFSKHTGRMGISFDDECVHILETKANAERVGEYLWMALRVRPGPFELYREMGREVLKRGGCVLWAGEERRDEGGGVTTRRRK